MRDNKFLYWILILQTVCFVYSCGTNCQSSKTMKIGNILDVTVDTACRIVEQQGIDSYSFKLVEKNSLLLHGELGTDINKLLEPDFPVLDIRLKDSLTKHIEHPISEKIVYFSDAPADDQQVNTFATNYYYYDTINNISCRIVRAKRPGIGVTGIYIPKLKDGRSLCLYAENLDSVHQAKIMSIFYSLRYSQSH